MDVANFGDRRRIIPEQVVVRDGVYRVLQDGFSAVGIAWAECDHEDRGDGLFVLVPPEVAKSYFVDRLPRALVSALSKHNSLHSAREQIRLRMAVHAGEVIYDDHGVTGPSINLAFRLIDAPAVKAALDESSGVLVVVVSQWFFDEVVRHSPPSKPASYRSTRVSVKETDTIAWIALPDHPYPPEDNLIVSDRTQPVRPETETLVGRNAELSRLTELMGEVVAGAGRAVLVEGEPGIGKSALVRAACAAADDRRCTVLWGAGDELGQALPLLPLLDALRMPGVSSHKNPRGETIARLLRGEVPLGGADPVAAASAQIVALAGELCARGPVVLVIDDLQWADRPTIAVWARLSRSISQLRLLLIGITRPVPQSPALHALRRAAADCVHLSLGPLPKTAVMDFVAAAVGGKPGEDLIRLADGAAGNPLFLTELIDALHREDALHLTEAGVAEMMSDGVPESLSAAIENRLEFAVGWVGEVLRAAALLGVEFSATELAVVLDRRIPRLRPTLDEARAAGVLQVTGENLAFRHPLIRQVLYDAMPAAVRTAWHLDAARALAVSGAQVQRVARQLLCAVRDPQVEILDDWLTAWLVTAAPALVAQSPSLAVELLRTAVSAPTAGDSRAGVLACRLADALFRTGDITEAERVATDTAAMVTEPGLMVDLQWTLTQCRAMTGRSAESLAALERTLAAPGIDPQHRTRLLVLTARTQRDLGKVGIAVRFANQALTEAEIIGDRWSIAWALHVLIIGSMMRGDIAAALPLFERAIEVVGDNPGLTDLGLLLQINQAVALGDMDRYPEAIAAAKRVRQLADHTGSLVRLAQAQSALGRLLFDIGHWDDAQAEVGILPDEFKDPGATCCDRGVAAVIAFHRGDPATAQQHLSLAEPSAEKIGNRVVASLALARSLDHEIAGAPGDALAVLTAGVANHAEELEEMEDLLPDAVRLAVCIGDQPTATELVEQAEMLMERSSVPHRSAAALYCRGLLNRDPDRLLLAAKRYSEAGRLLPRANALEAATIAIADSRTIDEARAPFTAADHIYTSLRAKTDTNRLRSMFRRYGV